MNAGALTILRQVVIASGPEPRSRALPGIQLLPDGQLLVAFRSGKEHPWPGPAIDDGAVMIVRSQDGGRTWSEPRAVFALPGWDCAGGRSIVQLPDGILSMFVMQARWRRGAGNAVEREMHVFPTYSTDNGLTWGALGKELRLFEGWTEPNTYGMMQVLSDGRWMIPAYGSDSLGGPTYSIVAFSQDQGQTWGERVIVAQSQDILFYEPALMRLEDGRFLAVIRTQDPPFDSYQTYSVDEGRTWTSPKRTGFSGQTPYLFRLRSGAILCAYRDRDPHRLGISYSITEDGGETWFYGGPLYRSPHWNCGSPGLVRLPSGDVFCVYYTAYTEGNCEVQGLILRENI
ncbi:MAG: exo-alpha-sialidase [Chloroflexi bacterium]|nr:exo-alpha-sialidase [Chloroflexota bacterium]